MVPVRCLYKAHSPLSLSASPEPTQAAGSGALKPSNAIAASMSVGLPGTSFFTSSPSHSPFAVTMNGGSSSVLTLGVMASSSSSVSVSSPDDGELFLTGVESKTSMGTSLSSSSSCAARRSFARTPARLAARAFAHAHSSDRSLLAQGSRARTGSPRLGEEGRVGGEEGRSSQISLDVPDEQARRFGVAGTRGGGRCAGNVDFGLYGSSRDDATRSKESADSLGARLFGPPSGRTCLFSGSEPLDHPPMPCHVFFKLRRLFWNHELTAFISLEVCTMSAYIQ